MRLPINLPWLLYGYILSIPRHNDLLVENLRFRCSLRTSVLLAAFARGVPWELEHDSWSHQTRLLGVQVTESCMIIRLLVLTQYQRVTDRQTDRETLRLPLSCTLAYYIVERDN